MPERTLRLLPTVGTVLITAVLVGARDDAVPAYALLYFWVVLSAFYFFGRQEGLVHLGGVFACFTAVLLTDRIAQGAMLGLMGLGTLGVTGVMLALLRERADTLILSLDAAARTDALTGVLNRRAFDERFGEEIARVARTQRVLTLLVLDVDGFKLINDRLGHQAGDRVLQRVAGILRSGRGIDEVARLGGDEFALLLPETDAAGAAELAQRICHRSERASTGTGPAVELSIGIAAWPSHGRTEGELFDAADSALYAAKQHGGSRAEVFDASMRRVGVH
jgi:diguanylate cyclase (GGDEF)-like protein